MSTKTRGADAPEDPPPPPPPIEGAGNGSDAPELSAGGPEVADKVGDGNGNARKRGANVDNEAGISTAKGQSTDALGEQVHPATQTSEKDGARTLVNPKTDPGPYIKEGRPQYRHPDRSKGEHRIGDANEPMKVMQRVSTGHDHGFARPGDNGVFGEADLPPETFVNGAASDVYNKEQGEGLTDIAKRKAAEGRERAPLHE